VAYAPVALIEQVPLFAGLDQRELRSIAESLKDRSFPAGGTVVEEGATGLGFFVIESGAATVSVGGREVKTLGAGDTFGEIALIADIPRTATIRATTELRCYGMTVWDFRSIVEANASIAWKLMQSLARALAAAEQHGV